MMTRSFFWCLVMLAAHGVAGCNPRYPTATRQREEFAAKTVQRSNQEAATTQTTRGVSQDQPTRRGRRSPHEPGENWLPPLRAVGGTVVGATTPSWSRGAPFTESHSLERIERELQDALNVRPTLVVWLFDQSAAAGTTRRAVAAAIGAMHARLSGRPSSKGTNSKKASPNTLLTAVVCFGETVNVLTSEPLVDADAIPASEAIAEKPAASTQAYAAVLKAAELFAPYRMRGHEVVFVLVAHSASADEANYKSAVEALNKAAIPVFGIGPAAPFGRLADSLTAATRPIDASLGHESRHAERIQLFLPDRQGDAELADSGYGPFHLERICRATRGQFLRIRPGGSTGWTTGDDGEINPELLRKYAPDYVSEDEYQKLLAENRACRALHEAARLPPAAVLIAPVADFRKQDDAAMARALSTAQRAPAENQPALERLHQTLAAGEADRPQLTRPRWQAAFDLAYGRACAARARNEGYNHMLAVLKNGKPFANPESTTWSLQPAEGIAGRSDLDKIAKSAKTYLQRVVQEHPGTPWAALAARELETPCGWEWAER